MESFKPYISVFVIIFALLFVVFSKMELRRMGYSVYKLSRELRNVGDDYRTNSMRFARLTRPDRIESLAQAKLELKKAGKGQIIQLVAGRVVLKH